MCITELHTATRIWSVGDCLLWRRCSCRLWNSLRLLIPLAIAVLATTADLTMEMEIFILKTVKKLRKETPRRFKDLRTSCDKLIETLSDNLKNEEEEKEDDDADKYFDLLQSACETKQPKLMEIALDAMKFLIGQKVSSLDFPAHCI
jgi:hypothetical protein